MPDVNVTILDALDHEQLWRPWLKQSTSWEAWRSFLRVLFLDLPLNDWTSTVSRVHWSHTASADRLSKSVVGLRSASRRTPWTLAFIAAYLGRVIDWSPYLVPGESAGIRIVAVDRRQAQVIFGYIRRCCRGCQRRRRDRTPENDDFIELKSGISIEVQTAIIPQHSRLHDHRAARRRNRLLAQRGRDRRQPRYGNPDRSTRCAGYAARSRIAPHSRQPVRQARRAVPHVLATARSR